jgi:hypothetical protein
LEQWRSHQGPETIRFSETGSNKIDRAVSLLRQLQSRRSGILFLGYSLASRGRTHQDLFSLLIQLVVDSLKYLRECKCLTENRSVRVIKEAESGFDSLFLHKMTKHLGEVIALEFPGNLAVLPVEAVPKGRTVLLECADLIAGGMLREPILRVATFAQTWRVPIGVASGRVDGLSRTSNSSFDSARVNILQNGPGRGGGWDRRVCGLPWRGAGFRRSRAALKWPGAGVSGYSAPVATAGRAPPAASCRSGLISFLTPGPSFSFRLPPSALRLTSTLSGAAIEHPRSSCLWLMADGR